MTLKRCFINSAVVASFLATQLVASYSLAQFEDFPPPPPLDDFSAPPPPTGTLGTGGSTIPTEVTPSLNNPTKVIKSTSKNVKNGILTEKQKEKFAKASAEDITFENFPERIRPFDFPNF